MPEKRGKQGKSSSISVVPSSMLSQDEADLHFHIAQTHHRGTRRSSSDHTVIVGQVVQASWRSKQKMMSTVELSVNDQLKGLFSRVEQHMGKKDRELVTQLAGNFSKKVEREVNAAEYHCSKEMSYSIPTKDTEIARKYTTGVNSIMNSLPFPLPEVRFFGGVIPVKLLFNNIVALDIPLKTYDTDNDWTADIGNYTGEFYQKYAI